MTPHRCPDTFPSRVPGSPSLNPPPFSCVPGVGGECGFTACIDQYVAAGVEEGPTPAFCVLAASTSDCMAPLSSSCRSYIPYETQRRMLDNLMKRHDCATILATHHPPPAAPDGAPPPAADECQYRGTAAPAHCGLFGDPHLKTFGGAYMTCGVGGAWPLLNTPALAVQVTNEQVGPDNHATATTKVRTRGGMGGGGGARRERGSMKEKEMGKGMADG